MKQKIIYGKNGSLGKPFWWRFRSKTKSQRFREVEELKKEILLIEEEKSILEVLGKSLGRNILLIFSISDIRRVKGKGLFFLYLGKGKMNHLFSSSNKIYGSYLALKVCTEIKEVEDLFYFVTNYSQHIELLGIQFGGSFFSSFFDWFDHVERTFSWKLKYNLGLFSKKREEIMILFLLTLIFYEYYLYTIYSYFQRWLQ